MVLNFLAVDNFDFTRKKLNFWTKNEDFEQCDGSLKYLRFHDLDHLLHSLIGFDLIFPVS